MRDRQKRGMEKIARSFQRGLALKQKQKHTNEVKQPKYSQRADFVGQGVGFHSMT